jgi:hypothetical protein
VLGNLRHAIVVWRELPRAGEPPVRPRLRFCLEEVCGVNNGYLITLLLVYMLSMYAKGEPERRGAYNHMTIWDVIKYSLKVLVDNKSYALLLFEF